VAIARTVEQVAAQDAVRAFARAYDVGGAAREECGGGWARLWRPLADLGMFAVAVPKERGGLGGTFADLAAMLEQAGAELVPGPLISTAIGAVLCADAAVPQEISMEICAGQRPVGIAGARTGAVVYAGADGHLHISGTFASVDGAGPGALLILPGRTDTTRVWVLVEPHHGGLTITPLPGIDFAAPMAQVECRDVPVTAVLGSAYRAIDDLYITAVAAVCAPRCFVALSKPVRWPRMRRPWMPTNGRWPPPQRPPSPSTPRSTTPKTVSRCSAPSDSPGNTTLSCT
jgi:3-oxochol-4-en-24-oyl-CoA dehydrogenase